MITAPENTSERSTERPEESLASEKSPVTYAPRNRIDAFEELAEDFVHEVLGLPWALMTDESSLSDFSGCGLDGRDDLTGLDDEAHRAFWDEWVVECVCQRYRVEAFPVTISMVQLSNAPRRFSKGSAPCLYCLFGRHRRPRPRGLSFSAHCSLQNSQRYPQKRDLTAPWHCAGSAPSADAGRKFT
jgi:hypothetical protein